MGKSWDHGVPGAPVWAEVLRVLKPGAPLMAFGGTRTFHRLACALEDAGFEIRDTLMWIYASGFPKSHNISKALDRSAGADRQVVGASPYANKGRTTDNRIYQKATPSEREVVTAPTDAAKTWSGFGTALKPAYEPIILGMKPCAGTFAQNALTHGVAGINVEAGRIGTTKNVPASASGVRGLYQNGHKQLDERSGMDPHTGRWPANVLFDEAAAAALDEASGVTKSTGGNGQAFGKSFFGGGSARVKNGRNGLGLGDSGGASRFFYVAKASRRERGEGNTHPTVKPIKLSEYLARLLLPPERDTPRVLLNPFSGSGSEAIGALRAGWDQVCSIEREKAYVKIAKTRFRALAKAA